MLTVESLHKSYGRNHVLRGTAITIDNEIKVLLGVNGCGKSTLLKIVAGIVQPDSGRIKLNEDDITYVPPERRRIGYVPQKAALFPHLTVEQNILYGVRDGRDRTESLARLSRMLGLEDLLGRHPHELSGGYKSRVSLARALAPEPALMLLDEPLSDIDVTTKENLLPEFREVIHFMGIPAMYVTHDPVEAAEIGDTFAIMQEGVVHAMDSARAAFEYVRYNDPSGYREEPLQAAARTDY